MEALTPEQQDIIREINDKSFYSCSRPFSRIINCISLEDLEAIVPFVKNEFYTEIVEHFGPYEYITPVLHYMSNEKVELLLKLGVLENYKNISANFNLLLTKAMKAEDKTYIQGILEHSSFKYHDMPRITRFMSTSPDETVHPVYHYLSILDIDYDLLRFVYHNLPTRPDKLAFLDDIKYFYDKHKSNPRVETHVHAVQELYEELKKEYDDMLLIKAARH